MLGNVEIVFIQKNYILFQGKESPAKTKLMPAKLRTVFATFGFYENLICWLHAVLVNFEFFLNVLNIAKNQHMNPRFPRDGYVRKPKKCV